MADIAKVSSENLILVRKNNSNPFEENMPYVKTDEATGKRTWYINGKNTNIEVPAGIPNEQVTAFHDACMWYIMLGNGILQGVYSECQASLANKNFSIGSGMIMFGGRLIEIGKNSQVNVDLSSFNDQTTVYIKLQMIIAENDTESDVGIYATANSSEKTDCLNGPGTYEIILFKITGTRVEKIIPTLEPGVAQNATNLLGTGRIAGVPLIMSLSKKMERSSELIMPQKQTCVLRLEDLKVAIKIELTRTFIFLEEESIYFKKQYLLKQRYISAWKNNGGNSDKISFENSNSLKRFEGVFAVEFKANNWDFSNLLGPQGNYLPNAGTILKLYKDKIAPLPIMYSSNSEN